jgi:adenine-specific DNA-methyltransferase
LITNTKGQNARTTRRKALRFIFQAEKGSQKYGYDPHLDPQLVWTGKAERTSFEVPVVPLHIHERISPRNIVAALEKKRSHQTRLFGEGEVLPLDKRVEFYKHEMDWSNRLILGDSLLVMNSLLTKELMAGKVQMIS